MEKTNPLLNLRVLLEFDPKYTAFVAHCLETGSVVTADDETTAMNMMTELLEDEISFAIEHNNIRNLLSSAAPLDVWRKWQDAARLAPPKGMPLNIAAHEISLTEPEAELRFATANA